MLIQTTTLTLSFSPSHIQTSLVSDIIFNINDMFIDPLPLLCDTTASLSAPGGGQTSLLSVIHIKA